MTNNQFVQNLKTTGLTEDLLKLLEKKLLSNQQFSDTNLMWVEDNKDTNSLFGDYFSLGLKGFIDSRHPGIRYFSISEDLPEESQYYTYYPTPFFKYGDGSSVQLLRQAHAAPWVSKFEKEIFLNQETSLSIQETTVRWEEEGNVEIFLSKPRQSSQELDDFFSSIKHNNFSIKFSILQKADRNAVPHNPIVNTLFNGNFGPRYHLFEQGEDNQNFVVLILLKDNVHQNLLYVVPKMSVLTDIWIEKDVRLDYDLLNSDKFKKSIIKAVFFEVFPYLTKDSESEFFMSFDRGSAGEIQSSNYTYQKYYGLESLTDQDFSSFLYHLDTVEKQGLIHAKLNLTKLIQDLKGQYTEIDPELKLSLTPKILASWTTDKSAFSDQEQFLHSFFHNRLSDVAIPDDLRKALLPRIFQTDENVVPTWVHSLPSTVNSIFQLFQQKDDVLTLIPIHGGKRISTESWEPLGIQILKNLEDLIHFIFFWTPMDQNSFNEEYNSLFVKAENKDSLRWDRSLSDILDHHSFSTRLNDDVETPNAYEFFKLYQADFDEFNLLVKQEEFSLIEDVLRIIDHEIIKRPTVNDVDLSNNALDAEMSVNFGDFIKSWHQFYKSEISQMIIQQLPEFKEITNLFDSLCNNNLQGTKDFLKKFKSYREAFMIILDQENDETEDIRQWLKTLLVFINKVEIFDQIITNQIINLRGTISKELLNGYYKFTDIMYSIIKELEEL